MLRTFLTLLLCLSALPAHARCRGADIRPHLTASQRTALQREAESVPFGQGNHWSATRGSQTIHVVGTMHINDRRLNKVMRNLNPVIGRADAILLEVSHPEAERFWRTFKEHKSLFFLSKGPNVRELMSEAGWETLAGIADAKRLNVNELVKLKPWFLSMYV